jgi:hypothetical protein
VGSDVQKHAGGRPLKFKSPEEMEEKGLAYFKECEEKKELITITGLALALDTNRQTLCSYEDNDEFADTIKRLKGMVEHSYEKRMWTSNNPAAGIFCLKNLGWTDRQDIDINAKLRPSQYSPEEEEQLREFARLRALSETTKAIITSGDNE